MKRVGLAIGLFLLLLLGLYGVDTALAQGTVPRGTTVGGVTIGGMKPAAAREKLDSAFAYRPVTVKGNDMLATIDPEAAGLAPDWDATIAAAGTPSLNPITKVTSFFTTTEVPIQSEVDRARFNPAMEKVAGELTRQPADGGLELVDGKPHRIAPVVGQNVAPSTVGDAVVSGWLNPDGVDVDITEVPPAIGDDEIDAAEKGPAKNALAGDIVAHGTDKVDGIIPTARMGEIVTFVPRVGDSAHAALEAEVNVDRAREILFENLQTTEVSMKNATITLTAGGRSVTPHVDGTVVDWEKTLDKFPDRVTGTAPKTFDVTYKPEPATFTTEAANAATFNDVVGSFTTGGFSGPSGTNIALVARTVNGAIVAPGETFSLNGYTGPRGTAQGYVSSGVILNGHSDTAVGGGISQFATTLYNASYFSGMTDIAHTPHSYYISRYPAGREATVYEGAIDLVFRNDTPDPVLIEAGVSGNEVTVTFKGTKSRNVQSIPGGKWAYTQPQPMAVSGSSCSPSSGAPGFTTSDTRIITDLAGKEIGRDSTTTVYDPVPIVRCS
ncbi:VanW family protein [Corynebacterium pyruviciproducens]